MSLLYDDNTPIYWRNVLLWLVIIFVSMLLFGLFLYHLQVIGNLTAISLFSLCLLPYSISALGTVLLYATGLKKYKSLKYIPLFFHVLVLGIGGIVLKEGIICILIVLPFWLSCGVAGFYTVKMLAEEAGSRPSFFSSALLVLPLALLALDKHSTRPFEAITVSRSVILQTSPEEIWPHLLSMKDIQPSEGKWTFTQNITAVPRPSSAVVTGQGVGAIRQAAWGDNISFEEHITTWEDHKALSWRFVFPNSSVENYTDPHISPDGTHLKIKSGGYQLKALSPNTTKLTLSTTYDISTPINGYSALWGELFLGDIQENILAIIEKRSVK